MSSSHFQYEAKNSPRFHQDQLLQGDVLERTDQLAAVLEGLYPYAYQNPEKYPYFVVLTQSCDLVEEGQRHRKADHITLSAARPIEIFLEQEIVRLQPPAFQETGICLTSDKQKLIQKVERLLSNEESPFFYLHPSEQTPFAAAQVAYLRVTFPLRTDKHHDVCLKAKRVQLSPEFRAKLGWLTTLVFGRVATEDFAPDARSKYARDYVEGHGITWIRPDALQLEAKQRGTNQKLRDLPAETLREIVAAVEQKSQPEIVADEITRIARRVWPADEAMLERFRKQLLNDQDFRATQGR